MLKTSDKKIRSFLNIHIKKKRTYLCTYRKITKTGPGRFGGVFFVFSQ